MTKEELLSMGISEELAENLSQRISGLEKENADLKANAEEKTKDLEAARAKAEALNSQLAKAQETYGNEITALKISSGIEKALITAGAKNLKAVGSLLDREAIAFDEKGNLTGLTEQLEAIRQSDSYLFREAEQQPQISGLTAYAPEEGADENGGETDFSQMTYSQITDYLAKNSTD